jgi:formate dehydrogenase major subunit
MKVTTDSHRAKTARKMVLELLMSDQPNRDKAHDPDSLLWYWADKVGIDSSRFEGRKMPANDSSHPAMAFNLDD